MRVAELRPGDLLFARDSSRISIWIRRFDGGLYSHVAFWDGMNVLEASGDGGKIRARDIETFVLEHEQTAVYRFSRDGSTLGDPGWRVDPVIDVARSYLGSAYPYGELCLLGVLVALGRATGHPRGQEFFRTMGAELAQRFGSRSDASEKGTPMTCSQFVSMSFWEADPASSRRYALLVGYEPRNPWRDGQRNELTAEEWVEFRKLVRSCRERFLADGRLQSPSWYRDLARGHRGERAFGVERMQVRAGDRSLPASCVTPKDLERSDTLIKVGEVVV